MTPNRRREKKNKLKARIQKTNQRQIVTTRSLASLIGDINYLRFQFPQISLWMKSQNNPKTKAVAKGGCEASMKLNKQILGNLQTILMFIKQNGPKQLKDRTPNSIMTTYSSEDGRDMTLDNSNEQILDPGQWEGSWHLHSSNLERTSSCSNLAKKSMTNINRLENEMHSSQDRHQKNEVCYTQMESSISYSTSDERDFPSPYQSGYNDLHGTSSWVGELDCRCILLKTDIKKMKFVIRKWKAASVILHLM
ncbi:MAG: hypothetical protein EZS28_049942, partial [Streblomastix strix]